jgi:hypothetical protein
LNPAPANYERRVHITLLFLKNGELVAFGRNLADHYFHMFTRHSERDAFDNLFRYMSRRPDIRKYIEKHGIVVVNLAFALNGDIKISKPCINCAKYMQKINDRIKIRKIWWSTSLTSSSSSEDEDSPSHVQGDADMCGWKSCSVVDVDKGATLSRGELYRDE